MRWARCQKQNLLSQICQPNDLQFNKESGCLKRLLYEINEIHEMCPTQRALEVTTPRCPKKCLYPFSFTRVTKIIQPRPLNQGDHSSLYGLNKYCCKEREYVLSYQCLSQLGFLFFFFYSAAILFSLPPTARTVIKASLSNLPPPSVSLPPSLPPSLPAFY